MDVCCWNRPFDSQTQMRVHLEAEAVLGIITDVERGRLELLHSAVADLEIGDAPDTERRQRLRLLIPRQHRYVHCRQAVVERALELEQLGFPGIDALHVASAEYGKADVLLTTDDRLLRLGVRHAGVLNVPIANPLRWVQDMEGKRK
jgi:predicted nucleic acid-binding protein